MRFLELPADSYEKYIVKLNVNRAKRDEPSEMDRYVFVFSRCIEDSSTYGSVIMELVPEREVPIFHDTLTNAHKREIKDEHFDELALDGMKSVDIGSYISIIKSVSDFTTHYIAVIEDADRKQKKYYGLLSKNRGNKGRLEYQKYTSFAPNFHVEMCDYEAEQKKIDLENSVKNVQELEGLADTFQEIVSGLEQKKKQVENQQVTGECLRSLYQAADS
ncbi:hypothetical protein [Shimazuella kribbensis]|uniref:hypothetical protein n=1 Tax=Shimazuella kribbensis TaxID=139808 RepID=UPI0004052D37|nr:hypothetical protein [Shimazuella kribbensis]